MIIRSILLISFCLSGLTGLSQKKDKKTKEKSGFQYSYECEAKDYIQYDYYHLKIEKLNADTILISGDPDGIVISGKVLYSHESFSVEIIPDNGEFQFKVPVSASYGLLLISLEFEYYSHNETYINLNLLPDDFYLVMEKESVFDPETSYIRVESKAPLTKDQLQEIIDCLGTRKYIVNSCYDSNSIRITIPI